MWMLIDASLSGFLAHIDFFALPKPRIRHQGRYIGDEVVPKPHKEQVGQAR